MTNRYECNICGKEHKTEERCLEHLSEDEGIESNPEIYMTIHYDVEEEKLSEEDTEIEVTEENPNESSALTEAEVEELELATEVLKDYSAYSDTEKGMILSRAFDMITKREGKRAKKGFPEARTTRDVILSEYQTVIDKLADPNLRICPLCGESWNSIRENMSIKDRIQILDSKNGLAFLRVRHLQGKHLAIYHLVKALFEGEKYPETPIAKTPNPESCSEESLESLSREELADKIIESPELRMRILREWKKSKET